MAVQPPDRAHQRTQQVKELDPGTGGIAGASNGWHSSLHAGPQAPSAAAAAAAAAATAQLDALTAAEVLASFNQYPIRAMEMEDGNTKSASPGAGLREDGLQRDHSKNSSNSNSNNSNNNGAINGHLGGNNDIGGAGINGSSGNRNHNGSNPLMDDVKSVAPDLHSTLVPMSRGVARPLAGRADKDRVSWTSHCPGMTGIGGSLVPEFPGWKKPGVMQQAPSPVLPPPYATPLPSPKVATATTTTTTTATTTTGDRKKRERNTVVNDPGAGIGNGTSIFSAIGSSGGAAAAQITGFDPTAAPIEKEEFKTTFQFVVNEDAKSARNTVRKHVMREYRRRERWEQGLREDLQQQPPSQPDLGAGAGGADQKRRRKMPKASANSLALTTVATQETNVNAEMGMGIRMGMGSAGGTGGIQEQHARHNGGSSSSSSRNSSNYNNNDALVTPSSGSLSSSSSSSTSSAVLRPTRKKRRIGSFGSFAAVNDPTSGLVGGGGGGGGGMGGFNSKWEKLVSDQAAFDRLPMRGDPWAEVAIAEVDPFSSLKGGQLTPAAESLLHHYAWVMPSLMDEVVTGTVFHRIGWLYSCVAIHDPTPVHAIIGFTAAHIANLRGQPEPPLAMEHKSKAIAAINARMEDPREALSDGAIGAIANISGFELVDCNPRAFAMHMRGIHHIVSERGGLSSVVSNRDLWSVLIRLDVVRAYTAISAPRFPTWVPMRTLEPLAVNVTGRAWEGLPEISAPHGIELYEYDYCEEALRLVHALEDVVLLVWSASVDRGKPAGVPFRKLLSAHVTQLLRLQGSAFFGRSSSVSVPSEGSPIPSPAGSSPEPWMRIGPTRRHYLGAKVMRLATLVFLDLAVRELFDPSPTRPGPAIQRLRARFLGPFAPAAAGSTAWGRSMEMVMTVLLQADRVSLERPWRAWYFADAVTLTMKLEADALVRVEEGLRAYIEEIAAQDARDAEDDAPGDDGVADIPAAVRSRLVWDLDTEYRAFLSEWGAQFDDGGGGGEE